ncbi:NADP oxidoreductase [Nitrosomonas sp. Nm34]|uniref:NADH-quinone oxidoreductase subunit B family protein n=1 Tax=Nitrosomonas sp. Nm34 TaxID=1881055 RepID=UPI0008E5B8D4|nr:NADP oxidoreductase [Nitrosomonas sp. Nm34]SFI73666.1 NAD-reducing hydrogenase small subunit [Nitrosomonas sp. Nm34]
MTHKPKLKLATTSLAGCFGCHMSFLDMDERLIELLEHIEFDRSPFTDIKQLDHCDIGLIEGGVCNAENVHVLRTYRANCRILVAVGACAINGGVPALRNHFSLKECLEEAYVKTPDMINPHIPDDPELPLLLNKVYPVHEVVKIDYFLPGCPPSADTFYRFLSELIEGKEPQIGKVELRYD